MFMLMSKGGEIRSAQVQLPPITKSRRATRHRSRAQWITKMATIAPQHKCRYFAFRYMGQWLLCDIMDGGNWPVREMPGDAREAAEMWLIHKERP